MLHLQPGHTGTVDVSLDWGNQPRWHGCISFVETHYQEGPWDARGDSDTPRKVQGQLDRAICAVLFIVPYAGQYRERVHKQDATAQTAVASCGLVCLTLLGAAGMGHQEEAGTLVDSSSSCPGSAEHRDFQMKSMSGLCVYCVYT